METEKVWEAWQHLQDALQAYEETLQAEIQEALHERRMDALLELRQAQKRLNQLRSVLRRAEKLLP